eukprot:6966-Heterococcus_DN1.PRE.7
MILLLFKQILTVVKNAAASGTAAADALAAARVKARKEEAEAAAHLRKVLSLILHYTSWLLQCHFGVRSALLLSESDCAATFCAGATH